MAEKLEIICRSAAAAQLPPEILAFCQLHFNVTPTLPTPAPPSLASLAYGPIYWPSLLLLNETAIGVLLLVICTLGGVGNIVSILIFRHKTMR